MMWSNIHSRTTMRHFVIAVVLAFAVSLVTASQHPALVSNGASSASAKSSFGHNMLSEFMLAPGFTNFNHGSFGSVPKEVMLAQRQYSDQVEAYPDKWFRGDYQILLDGVRKDLAQYLSADADDLVLVENASSGVNAILRSLRLGPGDKVLRLSCAYAMVSNTLDYLSKREGFEVLDVGIKFPVSSSQDILDAVQPVLDKYAGDIKVAVFSHIVSVPAVILPVESLSQQCQERNITVVIDGAHALGQIPVNITKLEESGIDFWVGNGHKWLYSPKGSAVLWTSKTLQNAIVPTVISSEGRWDYEGEFEYTGTRDYTAFCAIKDALAFRSRHGDAAIMEYMHSLAVDGGNHLAKRWGTELVAPTDMQAAMVNIRLPSNDTALMYTLTQRIFEDYNMYVVVFGIPDEPSFAVVQDKLEGPELGESSASMTYWTRLSAQIYLELDDFVQLGEIMCNILDC